MEIEKIDKNFLTERSIPENARVFDVRNDPFEINGVFFSGGHFVRMPEEDAKKVNPGVRELHACTAGGRVRFSTDSSFLAFIADMNSLFPASHTTFLINAGFDIYRDNEYFKTVHPPLDFSLGVYTALVPTDGKMHSYTVVMPCYGGVRSLMIGVGEGAQLKSPVPFRDSAPVIYYGSSITQGGCASRPGLTYQELISRRLGKDYINLGFSGSARGEEHMAHYINGVIKETGADIFCYDYDHNAPDKEHLLKTHEPFFKMIRAENPDIPVIMVSKPDPIGEEDEKRRDIIKATYENALASGDKNVYFIDGTDLGVTGDATVDGCHPNDLGFYRMAEKIGNVIEKIGLR